MTTPQIVAKLRSLQTDLQSDADGCSRWGRWLYRRQRSCPQLHAGAAYNRAASFIGNLADDIEEET